VRAPRWLILGVASGTASFVGLLAPMASTANAVSIEVNAPGGDTRGVNLKTSDLGSSDVSGVNYPLPGDRTRTVTGWSLERVLTAAAGSPGASGWLNASSLPGVTFAPPSDDVNARISATSNEIVDRELFGAGRTPVLVENPDGSIDFIKPGVNGSPGAAYRYFVSVQITVSRDESGAKRLRLKVSPKAVDPGGRVSFTATVPGRDATGLTFAWTIREVDSGRTLKSSSRGGAFSRTFSRSGNYKVLVSLVGDSEFDPALESFTVGEPAKPKPSPKESGSSTAAPSGLGGYGSPGAGLGGSGFGVGSGGGGSIPVQPEFGEWDSRKAGVSDDLEQVSGVVIDPAASASATAPKAGGAEEGDPAGEGAFGLSGEAATLFGVGLLLALGGLIETRILFRRF